ncbi:hypothetical protein BEWA_021470 [Theileria equi strain WA]|uniref:Uncharacterized protein n=1 Tax=Theileria equi strain WA TaxID=1537102 RepID=L0AWL4_THEEQ|nr:hypothetical protein BEWA_021470 [Theileria equi strain WA]AFZ79299.1 hypothetical protein BEWA_021470 [Theileria equi strain WA]|eukprot:XP_004828965.1 hypothetical protein BEWA_021470 [Theileria equi strain WA]
MNILSKGEAISNSAALELVRDTLAKFKAREEKETSNSTNFAFSTEESTTTRKGHRNNDSNVIDEELWKLKVKKLNEFCINKADKSECIHNHVLFLESVEKYLSCADKN